jgi:hypothetical protein
MRTLFSRIFLLIVPCFGCRTRATSTDLSGRWVVELEATYRNDYPRNSMHLQVPPRPRATLVLTLTSDSLSCLNQCSFTGSLEAPPDSFLAPEPPDWAVTARLTKPDSVFVSIGPCCDAGALYLNGRLTNGRIQGRWFQNFLGSGDEGRFSLTRSATSQ